MDSAVIVAGGGSRRAGFNKLLADLGGRPVLQRTIGAFQEAPDVDEIIVVAADETLAVTQGWKEGGLFPKLAAVVEGGAERHLSVKAGLDALDAACTHVAVHDGARPLVSQEAIASCFRIAHEAGAAVCAHPVTDTLKRADADGNVAGAVDRDGLWGMETPQVFEKGILLRAYDQVLAGGVLVTDEVSALEAIGKTVRLVDNPSPNPKITFEADLAMASKLLP